MKTFANIVNLNILLTYADMQLTERNNMAYYGINNNE